MKTNIYYENNIYYETDIYYEYPSFLQKIICIGSPGTSSWRQVGNFGMIYGFQDYMMTNRWTVGVVNKTPEYAYVKKQRK